MENGKRAENTRAIKKHGLFPIQYAKIIAYWLEILCP